MAPGLLWFLAGVVFTLPVFLALIHLSSKNRAKPFTSGTVFNRLVQFAVWGPQCAPG